MNSYATAPVMVWELAGRPHRSTLGVVDTPGVCAMCARHCETTAPSKKWLEGKSFVDPGHLRARSDRVCEACAWTCTGKGMDQIRMWSIVARTDMVLPASNPKAVFAGEHLHFTSRADMRTVVDTLANPPDGQWVVSIAESGQKHTTPYSVINHGTGRWRVRMDALDVDATPDEFAHVFAHTVALRVAGHSADSIKTLTPNPASIKTPHDLDVWFHHAQALTEWRYSPLLHLTTFLPNKEHADEYRTRFPTPDEPVVEAVTGPAEGDPVPGRDVEQRGRGRDRSELLVGPGQDSGGDSGGQLDLFR